MFPTIYVVYKIERDHSLTWVDVYTSKHEATASAYVSTQETGSGHDVKEYAVTPFSLETVPVSLRIPK